ncbi:MAG: iron-sulfur cluster assembly protein, partial [Alphaproteobacteria bacterium]|nr:iron-sulfur cluster assembly protein [Alphaproteobacteria bacterium]
MTTVSEIEIRKALAGIEVPGRDSDPVSLGMILGLVVKDGNVGFSIEIDPADHEIMEDLRKTCEQTVHALPGVVSVTAVLTAEAEAEAPQAAPTSEASGIPGIGAIIAVA